MKPLTCLIKKEGNQYASLCVELDIASCGKNKKESLDSLRDAVEAYLEYMVAENRRDEIYRPVPIDDLKEFLVPSKSTCFPLAVRRYFCLGLLGASGCVLSTRPVSKTGCR